MGKKELDLFRADGVRLSNHRISVDIMSSISTYELTNIDRMELISINPDAWRKLFVWGRNGA